MGTASGVGYSNKTSSKEAATEAVKAAMAQMGNKPVDACIVYTTSKHQPEEVKSALRTAIGAEAKIIGGYAVGIITKDKLSYGGYEIGVATIASDQIKFDMFIEGGLGTGKEAEVGMKLARQIRDKSDKTSNMVLMYDSVRGQAASLLNMATPILEGMDKAFEKNWPETVGVGMLGDMQFQPTKQWFNDEIVSQSAMAFVMSGNVRMDAIIMHGCKPSSGYHKITKADGPVVLEIDNKPALEMIGELLGSDKSWEDYPLFVTLGVNKGKKFEDFKEENYANRLCMSIDKARKGLVMFEPDLKAGDEVQLMRRDINFDYIGKRADELFNRIGSRKPFFALYIDCAGRASAYCGTEREEAAEVQRVIGSKMPLLGMYSGVEVAKVGPSMQALDWTGVLSVWSVP